MSVFVFPLFLTNLVKYSQELYKSATVKLSGPIDFRHSYADMTAQMVTLANGTKVLLYITHQILNGTKVSRYSHTQLGHTLDVIIVLVCSSAYITT